MSFSLEQVPAATLEERFESSFKVFSEPFQRPLIERSKAVVSEVSDALGDFPGEDIAAYVVSRVCWRMSESVRKAQETISGELIAQCKLEKGKPPEEVSSTRERFRIAAGVWWDKSQALQNPHSLAKSLPMIFSGHDYPSQEELIRRISVQLNKLPTQDQRALHTWDFYETLAYLCSDSCVRDFHEGVVHTFDAFPTHLESTALISTKLTEYELRFNEITHPSLGASLRSCIDFLSEHRQKLDSSSEYAVLTAFLNALNLKQKWSILATPNLGCYIQQTVEGARGQAEFFPITQLFGYLFKDQETILRNFSSADRSSGLSQLHTPRPRVQNENLPPRAFAGAVH